MDYYQGVVTEYLRANRGTFVNTEYCLQLDSGAAGIVKGAHWYCDAVALSFEEKTIFLCEISFAKIPASLQRRLLAWSAVWSQVQSAVRRDGHLFSLEGSEWIVRPWVFIPEEGLTKFDSWQTGMRLGFTCKVTALEATQPWRYKSWDREIPIADRR